MKLRPALDCTASCLPGIAMASARTAVAPATGPQTHRHFLAQAVLALLAGGALLHPLDRPARAQAAPTVAPTALPVLRGVVSGQAIVSGPSTTPGAPATSTPRSLLTIDQSSQRAIIDWRSFDIGRDAEVLFRHALGAGSSTLNRIYDASPSVIQGRLTATGPLDANGRATPGGQILLINQNGILFDRGAQVSVPSLVASTLNLANSVFNAGPLTAGGLTRPAFEGGYDDTGATLAARPDGSRPGAIVIGGSGPADAAAPELRASAGGSIMVFAPSIEHRAGLITAPDGQVILAAGSRAYLALNDDASDLTLRGLRVEVEAVRDGPDLNLTNLVRNAGEIRADRGNVTLAALAINQEGRVSANTAVQTSGSIFLQARARNGAATEGGRLTLGAGSVTEVMPDRADTATLAQGQDYNPYRGLINASGRTVAVEGRIEAPGGRIQLNATDTTDAEGARVYLGAGSVVSVAGAWADVDPANSLRTFTVTSNELRNAPDQRDGILRGATVTVDLRRDSPILALDGYRGSVQRTVAERAAVGGELTITSTGDVIQRSGSLLDASGGGYRYGAATVATTQLLGDDGRIYDIASAPLLRRYVAQLDRYESTDPTFGIRTSLPNLLGVLGRYEAAYVEGRPGGSISIRSSSGLVLDGQLAGGVTIGARQLNAAPAAATLRIGEYDTAERRTREGQRIGDLTLTTAAADTLGAAFSADSTLTPSQRDRVTLAADQIFGAARVTADGRVETAFGTVELNIDGGVTVPAAVSLVGGVGAAMTVRAPTIDIAGDIRLPAGSLLLQALDRDAGLAERLTVRGTAELSTAGLWLNNATADGSALGPVLPTARRTSESATTTTTVSALDGGALTLQVNNPLTQTRIERGAVLDVSGGAALSTARTLTGGVGGSLAIATGGTSAPGPDWMQGELRGFALANGGASGGSLTLGLQGALLRAEGAEGTLPAGVTAFTPGFFANHGFARVTINASEGITVAAGADIAPQQRNLVVDVAAAAAQPGGASLAAVGQVALLPEHQRRAASLALNTRGGGAPGTSTLTVGEGARITTDTQGSISLAAVDALRVDGTLSAPGGSIALTLNGQPGFSVNDPLAMAPPLTLGETATLSVRGRFVPTPSDAGLVQGTLLGGGSVTLTAVNAGIDLRPGSLVDLSAVSQAVDVNRGGTSPAPTTTTLEGHAGTLTLRAQDTVTLAGTLSAQGGSAAAAGGSFALELNAPDGRPARPAPRRIVVAPGEAPVAPSADGAVDARVDPAALAAAGFERLRLQAEDRIEFQGRTTADFARGIRLDAPVLELAADAAATLRSTSGVALGQSLGPRVQQGDSVPEWRLAPADRTPAVAPREGNGVLDVSAGWLDLYGSFTIQGAALTRLGSEGDVRLVGRAVVEPGSLVSRQVGSLTTAGRLELRGDQVYPATRTDFTLAVRDVTPGDGNEPYLLVRGNVNADGSPAVAAPALSAAGHLTLQAPVVVQAGQVRAPFGQIDIAATTRAEFGADSVTSVSGEGLTVLYGGTSSNVLWRYQDSALTIPETIDRISAAGSTLAVQAPAIDVQRGARIDLRGGGDVLGVEFVPGSGGDNDITLAANTFAILPAARLSTMPYDAHTLLQRDPGFGFSLASGRDNVLYDSLTLDGTGSVAAGTYALLPARYALLPGAVLVQLQTGSAFRNLVPGQTGSLASGETVVAGWRSAFGTTVQESQSVGVVLRPGPAAVRRASDYNLNGAAFFADAASLARTVAPPAPWDAGRLTLTGASELTLAGDFLAAPGVDGQGASGRLAQFDIGGSSIAVVDQIGDARFGAGVLQLAAGSLSALGGSVLLGGRRTDTDAGLQLTTSATEVVLAHRGTTLQVPELLVVATDRVQVREGAVVEARAGGLPATNAAGESVIAAEAGGALLRLAGRGAQARVDRGGSADTSRGDVQIESGARLSAEAALLVDATRSTTSTGELRVGDAEGRGGSLALSSGRVTLGETSQAATPPSGLVLSNAQLASYAGIDALVLRAYEGIDFVGQTLLGGASLQRLELDAPLFRGLATSGGGAADVRVEAARLTLRASGEGAGAATPPRAGSGRAEFRAAELVLGDGAKALGGFADVVLRGAEVVRGEGAGSLTAAAPITIDAPQIVAGGGSRQAVTAAGLSADGSAATTYDVLARRDAAGAATAAAAAADTTFDAGGQIALEGRRVAVETAITARGGAIDLRATGTAADDGVRVGTTGTLDASGVARDFNGTPVAADAGRVSLSAAAGGVRLEAGSQLRLSADAAGGSAGRLVVEAASFEALGTLAAQAATTALGGTARLDLGRGDAQALNAALNAGGFAFERRLRVREGDLSLGSGDEIRALRVALVADGGRIDIRGRVGSGDAGGGGHVELAAAQGVTLHAGSEIRAAGSAAGAAGGEVRITAGAGGTIEFAAGATIDVRAGNAGTPGSVRFVTPRDATDQVGATSLQGQVLRRSADGTSIASVDLEATRRYEVAGAVLGAAEIGAMGADHATFIDQRSAALAAAHLGGLSDEAGAITDARVLGATEVVSTQPTLTVNAPWDLTDAATWLAGGRPGTLTLRAAGSVTIADTIGGARTGNALADHAIVAGDTWSIRIAAGADLGSADGLATRTNLAGTGGGAAAGDLLLSTANSRIRTGTGRIDLAAAGAIRFGQVGAAVFTAGRIGVADTEANGNNRWAVAGGDVTLRAGGDIVGATGAAGELWVNEWLRRPRLSNNQFNQLQPTDWWSYRSRFQQAVGTLAGGDVDVEAGGSLSRLSLMLPTTGRTFRDAAGQRQVDVQGGGDLRVTARDGIDGGGYLVGRGSARLSAGGDVGGTNPVQLYLMGASSGEVPAEAHITVSAGGSVHLQNIANPTTLFQPDRNPSDTAAVGPSFASSGNVPTFFTYAPTSRVDLRALSGDLTYRRGLARPARGLSNRAIGAVETEFAPAWPASLSFAALSGDVAYADALLGDNPITTFPSVSARVDILAGGSINEVALHASDREPSTVLTTATPVLPSGATANLATRLLAGTVLRASGATPRIVERAEPGTEGGFVFQLQALEGSILRGPSGGETVLTAPSLVYAGQDIVGASLQLQNLHDDDLTVVRARDGDFRAPQGVAIGGPGRLLLQAGRNIDLGPAAVTLNSRDIGGVVAIGNSANPSLPDGRSARLTLVAGTPGTVNLAAMDGAYAELLALNRASADIVALYDRLAGDADAAAVLAAPDIAALARRDPAYARWTALDQSAPRALRRFQDTVRAGTLPLAPGADAAAAAALYRLLNGETDLARLQAAPTIAALAATAGGEAYRPYVALAERYPLLYSDYVQRRTQGATPRSWTPIVFSQALADVTATVIAPEAVGRGSLLGFATSIQTTGGSDIDLWAPGGNIVLGLTTPSAGKTVGVLTNAGGAIRSVLSGDLDINQGKVITAQGGDILMFSAAGSIDAGRGARTSLTTPAPQRLPILDSAGNVIGIQIVIPASATGSGIQTLSSDPDGLGPRSAPPAGSVYLFAPAGAIDAGEAGIRSSGNIVLNAQTVRNASNISASGSAVGVPPLTLGTLATALAASGSPAPSAGAGSSEESQRAAATAARQAAAAASAPRPTILSVEVLGFGDKNCKEDDKECFAK